MSWNPALYQSKHSFVYQFGSGVVDLLNPQPGERILDLGCGTGQLAGDIAQRGAQVEGVDQSAEMVAQAKVNFPDLAFRVADARSFSVSDRVDAVFSNATLHWIHEASEVIDRVYAALKPGGRFVAEMGGKGNIQGIKDALRVAYEALGRTDFDARKPWYYPSPAEYATLLELGGFEVAFMAHFDRPTPLEGQEGFRTWVRMFGGAYLSDFEPEGQEMLLTKAEESAKSTLLGPDGWTADYRRLRFVAIRQS